MVTSGGSRDIYGIYRMSGGSWCEKTGAYVEFGQFYSSRAELHEEEKVSGSSPLSSDSHCPLATKIIQVMTREFHHQRTMLKPWNGPLPKKRISPPKTLGDAVIKNKFYRLRGGQLIPVSFKMVLPSTDTISITCPDRSQVLDQSAKKRIGCHCLKLSCCWRTEDQR
jgi:hypothetical protein